MYSKLTILNLSVVHFFKTHHYFAKLTHLKKKRKKNVSKNLNCVTNVSKTFCRNTHNMLPVNRVLFTFK